MRVFHVLWAAGRTVEKMIVVETVQSMAAVRQEGGHEGGGGSGRNNVRVHLVHYYFTEVKQTGRRYFWAKCRYSHWGGGVGS